MDKGEDVILVTGATGKQGGAVARELLANRHAVTVMTRKPETESAKALAALGANVIQGDLDDRASLRRALGGVWGVFAVQNFWETGAEREEEQGTRIAKLAKKAGVQHYVYTSVSSADRKTGIAHFDSKWRIEEAVRALGFPSFCVLRPVAFMENFLDPSLKSDLEKGVLRFGIKPDTVLQMIAVSDIGKYGLLAFEKHSELKGRAIDLAGDAQTMVKAAQILGEAMGKTIAFEQAPLEQIRQFSEDAATMLEWLDRVGYDVDIPALASEYGIHPTTLTEWAERVYWG